MQERPLPRVVIDTNVYVSGLLRSNSVPSEAVLKAEKESEILVSEAVLAELAVVFRNPKFDKYIDRADREQTLRHIESISTLIDIVTPIRACRDPRDDKFLEVAVHGQADLIVSGDRDVLDLDPFRGIAIVAPAAYLDLK